jgi:hypothetical protein
MDVPSSTTTQVVATFSDPVLTDSFIPYFLDNMAVDVGSSVVIPGATIDVPEPAAGALVLAAIGTLALLRARRGRVR